MITYMRSGDKQQYLHRTNCPRYHWWNRLLGQTVDWPWATRVPRDTLLVAVSRLNLHLCRQCRPLDRTQGDAR